MVFNNCPTFTNYISKIDNTQIDNAKDIDVIMMHNLTECKDDYSKTYGSLWQYYIDKAALLDAGQIKWNKNSIEIFK